MSPGEVVLEEADGRLLVEQETARTVPVVRLRGGTLPFVLRQFLNPSPGPSVPM